MAEVAPITFPSPGFYGLNKEAQHTLLSPSWATESQNALIDEAGRLAARKGWTKLTVTPMSGAPTIRALIEYLQNDGTSRVVAAAGNKLWDSTDNGATWNDRTGVLTPAASQWQFATFNNKVFAAQVGHALAVKSGAGNFAAATAATGVIPTNPVAICAAFGRLWCINSDLFTIQYCALGDDTKWATVDGGGTVDLRFLWTQGTDQGVAIAAYGANLVFFGKRHIFIEVDGRGSDRGLDPTQMYVTDTIEGVGCLARDSVQAIGAGDMQFLCQSGITSLSRVIQEQATPMVDSSGNSRTYVTGLLLGSNVDQYETKSVYSPENKFYLITTENANVTFCVDMRGTLQDGTRRVTEWPEFIPTAMCKKLDGTVLYGWPGGIIGYYNGYLDNLSTYRFVFQSGWLDLEDLNAILKIGKRIKIVAYSPAGLTLTIKWFYDFRQELHFNQLVLTGDGPAEYGTGLYGTAEYSGGLQQRIETVPMDGSGQYVKLGCELEVNGQPFAIQSLTAYFTKGRLA